MVVDDRRELLTAVEYLSPNETACLATFKRLALQLHEQGCYTCAMGLPDVLPDCLSDVFLTQREGCTSLQPPFSK